MTEYLKSGTSSQSQLLPPSGIKTQSVPETTDKLSTASAPVNNVPEPPRNSLSQKFSSLWGSVTGSVAQIPKNVPANVPLSKPSQYKEEESPVKVELEEESADIVQFPIDVEAEIALECERVAKEHVASMNISNVPKIYLSQEEEAKLSASKVEEI